MSRLGRFSTGDALIGLAVLSLVFAALLPTFQARRFDRIVEQTTQDVDDLRSGVERARELNGAWPPATEPGAFPQGLAGAFPERSSLGGTGYVMEWRVLDQVHYVLRPVVVPPTPVLDPDEEPDPEALELADAPPDSAAVELAPAVRDMGAITVHAPDDRLLAALLARYGTERSFVRDTTWTLVIPPSS